MSGYRTHGWVEFNLHYNHEALFYIQVYKIRKLAVNIKLIYTQCFYTSKVYWLMALWKSEKHSEYRFIFTAKVPQSTGFWPRVSQLRYKFGARLDLKKSVHLADHIPEVELRTSCPSTWTRLDLYVCSLKPNGHMVNGWFNLKFWRRKTQSTKEQLKR